MTPRLVRSYRPTLTNPDICTLAISSPVSGARASVRTLTNADSSMRITAFVPSSLGVLVFGIAACRRQVAG
jgi:hypothetical protein